MTKESLRIGDVVDDIGTIVMIERMVDVIHGHRGKMHVPSDMHSLQDKLIDLLVDVLTDIGTTETRTEAGYIQPARSAQVVSVLRQVLFCFGREVDG